MHKIVKMKVEWLEILNSNRIANFNIWTTYKKTYINFFDSLHSVTKNPMLCVPLSRLDKNFLSKIVWVKLLHQIIPKLETHETWYDAQEDCE